MVSENKNVQHDDWLVKEAGNDKVLMELHERREELYSQAARTDGRSGYLSSLDDPGKDVV